MKRICSIFILVCMLSGCGNDASSVAEVKPGGDLLATLPLKRGFYVSSDTPCGEASNATLLLMRRDGINGSRDSCEFSSIEKVGPQHYRVTESCGDLLDTQDGGSTEVVEWEVLTDASFRSKSQSGWERSFRYCEQSSLPEDWRDNDISDVVGE